MSRPRCQSSSTFLHNFLYHSFALLSFYHVIWAKNNGSRWRHLRDVRNSKVTVGPPAAPVTRTAQAPQWLKLNVETTPTVRQESCTVPFDVQILADHLRSVRLDFARLLHSSNRKQRPTTAIAAFDRDEKSLEGTVEEEVLVPDKASLEIEPFLIKLQAPTFGQLEVQQSSHRAYARLLDYCYYCLVNK